jgi:hypothetical protein
MSALLLSACTENQLLYVKVKCKGNDQCLFKGEDVPIDIIITNKHKSTIGYPLEFSESTGPSIRLIDTRTKKETDVPTGLAVFDLKEKFTMIKPGKSLVIEEAIPSYYIKQICGASVDVTAEITMGDTILVDGKHVDFVGSDTIRIVGNDKP